VTKSDLRTGGLLAKRTHIQEPYRPIFPVNFYTDFDGYLKENDTTLEVLKGQGCDSLSVPHRLADDRIYPELM
jgi:predicted RecB family nuclease